MQDNYESLNPWKYLIRVSGNKLHSLLDYRSHSLQDQDAIADRYGVFPDTMQAMRPSACSALYVNSPSEVAARFTV